MIKKTSLKTGRSVTVKRILKCIFALTFFFIFTSAGLTQSENYDLKNDAEVILQSRQGMDAVIAYMTADPELFGPDSSKTAAVLTAGQIQDVRDLWARFLDYQVILDITWKKLCSKQSVVLKPADDEVFVTAYAAFLTRYRYALDFIGLVDYDKRLRIVLNEPVAELGLPKGSYSDFKFRFLNVSIAADFASLSLRHIKYTLTKIIQCLNYPILYEKMIVIYGMRVKTAEF